MKVILDIKENRVPFFMELLESLDYISVLKLVKDKESSKIIQDLADAFNDVKLYEEGKKILSQPKTYRMSFRVIATEPFEKKVKELAKKHKSLSADLASIFDQLADEPTLGTPLGKECYKIRVAISSKGKGKSGGARLITYVLNDLLFSKASVIFVDPRNTQTTPGTGLLPSKKVLATPSRYQARPSEHQTGPTLGQTTPSASLADPKKVQTTPTLGLARAKEGLGGPSLPPLRYYPKRQPKGTSPLHYRLLPLAAAASCS